MPFSIGQSVRVINQPDDPFTGTYQGIGGYEMEREGGGESIVERFRIRRMTTAKRWSFPVQL